MSDKSNERWRSIARSLKIVGSICFFVFFLSPLVLVTIYYPTHRPKASQPERGLTTGLSWTHPVRYGTELEEKRLQRLFGLIFPSFGLMIAGDLIKIYKLGDYSGLPHRPNPPWDHKWGP